MSEKQKQKKNHPKNEKQAADNKKGNKVDTGKAANKKHGKTEEKNLKTLKENPLVKKPVAPLEIPFVNSDDVLNITEKPNAKYAKREIKDNWSKFDLPEDNYEAVEASTYTGADFKELLHMPMSMGGHFQFKHEKSWGENKRPTQYHDLFSLDVEIIAEAISCVPFYERNRLDPSLFSADQIAEMKKVAMENRKVFESKHSVKEKVMQKDKTSPDKVQQKQTNVIINNKDISSLLNMPFKSKEATQSKEATKIKEATQSKKDDGSVAKVNILIDDIIGDLLETNLEESDILESKTNVTKSTSEVASSSLQKSSPAPSQGSRSDVLATKPDDNLDQWLDEYLDS